MRLAHVLLAASLLVAACSGDDGELTTETPEEDVATAAVDAAAEADTDAADTAADGGDAATADAEVDTDSGDTVDEPADAATHDSATDTAPEPSAAPAPTATSAPTTTRARPSTTTTWKGLQVPENASTLPPEDIAEHDPEPVEPVVIEVGDQGTSGGVTYEFTHTGTLNEPDPRCGGAYTGTASSYKCSCRVFPEFPEDPEKCSWINYH